MAAEGSPTDRPELRTAKCIRTLTISLGIGVLAYGIALAALSRAGFPSTVRTGSSVPYLSDKPVGEDAYYMLSVARNVARGRGIVYNGRKKTTGVQPLATVIYAGLIWGIEKAGGNEWTIVRSILAFGVVLLILFAHVIGVISAHLAGRTSAEDRAVAYGLGFCFALLNFSVLRLFTYGLETSMYLLILSVAVLATMRIGDGASGREGRYEIVLGCLFGAAALARIDFLALAALFLVVATARRKMSIRRGILAGGICLMIVSPWLVWVKFTGGSWMPSSGLAQAALPSAGSLLSRLTAIATALADHATPWAYEANRLPLVVVGAASGIAVWGWLSRTRGKDASAGRPGALARNNPFYFEWAVSLAALVLVYAVFFRSRHFYLRYTAPVLVLVLPVLAGLVQRELRQSRKWLFPALVSAMLLSFAAAAFVSLHTGTVGNDLTINAGFIRQEFPDSARIGAFQSGVLGFFHENVFNLDGKIDVSALHHLRSGTMSQYLDRERIDVVIDWPSYIYGNLDREYLDGQWVPRPTGLAPRRSVCLVRLGSGLSRLPR